MDDVFVRSNDILDYALINHTDTMEVVQIQVKPRRKHLDKPDTIVSIEESECERDEIITRNSDEVNDSSETINDEHHQHTQENRETGSTTGSEDDLDSLLLSPGESVSIPPQTTGKLPWVDVPIDDDNSSEPSSPEIGTTAKDVDKDDNKSNDEESQIPSNQTPNVSGSSVAATSENIDQSNGIGDDADKHERESQPPNMPFSSSSGESGIFTNGPFPYLRKLIARAKRIRKRKIHPEKCDIYVTLDDGSLVPNQENNFANDNDSASHDTSIISSMFSVTDSGFGSQGNDDDNVHPLDNSAIDTETETKTYYHYLFKFLFWFGLCPRRLEGNNWIASWIPFILLGLVSILQATIQVKHEYFWKKDKLLRCIGLGYYTNGVLLRVYMNYLMIFKWKDIKELVHLLTSFKELLSTSKVIRIVAFPLTTSIVIAIVYCFAVTIEVFDGYDYDIEDLLGWRAYRLLEYFLIWNKETHANQTTQIAEQIDANYTTTVSVIGVAGFFIQITGTIYGNIIVDICIVVAVSVFSLTVVFLGLLNFESKQTGEEYAHIWEFYKKLRAVSKQTEKAFGLFLQFVHVQNMFLASYVSFEAFMEDEKWYIILLRACILVKVAYFYLTSANTSRVNPKLRGWTHKMCPGTHTPFLEGSEYVTTTVLLDQLKHDPIGVGSSLFYIDYSFLWRFITYVSSYFFFFVQHSE